MTTAKKKKKPFSKRFYHLEEEEIQTIIANAKAGDSQQMERLLEVFENFLAKYINVLYYGKYSLEDQDMRRFVALFLKDKSLRLFTLRNQLNPQSRKAVNDIINGISYMVKRYGDKQDVMHTVQMSFIQCVVRYERKGTIPFSGYIYSYFYYMLKKNIDEYLIDQLGLKTFPLITESDAEEDGERQPGYYAPVDETDIMALIPDEIDEYWVAGDTSMPPFDRLTQQQRQLIRWRYILVETAGNISDRISEHPKTVRDNFKKIRIALREAMAQDGM